MQNCRYPRIVQLANGDIMLLMLLIMTGPRPEVNINQALIKHQSRLHVNKTLSLIISGDILTTFSFARLRQGFRCVVVKLRQGSGKDGKGMAFMAKGLKA